MSHRPRSLPLLLLALLAAPLLPAVANFPADAGSPAAATAPTADSASSLAAASGDEAAKIVSAVMGPSPLEGNLRRLTDGIGGRVSGSPRMERAVEWGVKAFRAADVAVSTEKYNLPVRWSEGDTRLEVLGPGSFPLRLVAEGQSPPTPRGGIEARVVFVADGTEEDFSRAGSVKGAILLVSSEIGSTWADLFDEYLRPPPIIARALQGGAAAILWTGARERMLLYRHTNSPNGTIDRIPQAVVAREDALRLARRAAADPSLRVRLSMPNRVDGPVEQENVVAEIRGREKPEEIVILGAHLDSWELGTGALDDGCNAALVIEAARALRASGPAPRRTIRFILFSGEEQGMLGSLAYVRAHRAEMERIRAMITFDSGTGRVTGYSLGGRRDIETGLREAMAPLDSWGATRHTADAFFGTDNFDFLLEGVPTLVANQEIADYLPNYHAASDTFDKVDLRELRLNTALAAVTAWGIADRPEPIGKRQTRPEVEVLLRETGLGDQMRTLGVWDSWQNGTRGRKL